MKDAIDSSKGWCCDGRRNARPANDWRRVNHANAGRERPPLGSGKQRLATLEVGNLLSRLIEDLPLPGLGQLPLDNFRCFRRADAPPEAKDEIPADPGGHQQSRGGGGQQSEPAFATSRRADERDKCCAVDQAVEGGRLSGGMLAGNGEPVDPAHDAGPGGSGGGRPGGDAAQLPAGRIILYPVPRLNGQGNRNQDSRTVREDGMQRMPVHDRMPR